MSVEIKMTLPDPPEGFEYTGECRPPKQGEWFVHIENGTPLQAALDHGMRHQARLILRKLPKWRESTFDDFVAVLRNGGDPQGKMTGPQGQKIIDIVWVGKDAARAAIFQPDGTHYFTYRFNQIEVQVDE